MARHKDAVWNLPERHLGIDGAILCALMDIRDELKILNATLSCHRVPAGMDAIMSIDRRLKNRMPMKNRTRK